jgi:chromosome segregation ATPase
MGKYDDMLSEISARASKLPKLVEETKAAMAKFAASKDELNVLADKYSLEQKRREEAEAMEAKANEGLAEVTKKYEHAEHAAAKTAEDLKAIQGEFGSVSKMYTELKETSRGISAQKSDLEKRLGAKEQEIGVRDHLITEQDAAITQLKRIADQYHNAITELHKEANK